MITLAQLMRQHQRELKARYQSIMQRQHRVAMQAIMDCHTPACGTLEYKCESCLKRQSYYRSCGHRSCPSCQHSVNNEWLDRQRHKLLPLEYYMVTFTLPYELRSFVWHHQKWAYQTLFDCAVATLTEFAKKDKKMGDDIGMTGVLHTHSRELTFHPHGHFIVPGGGLNKKLKFWQKKPGKYLFNGKALAKMFRGKFLAAMKMNGFYVPDKNPTKWIAQCQHVGSGEPALVYLARYLYRGVVNEKNIINYDGDKVTFRYQDSDSKQWKTKTESAVNFLWRILQHVLPKGFRRVRDFGFLHGNAKKVLKRLQMVLHVNLPALISATPTEVSCPCCGRKMMFIWFKRYQTKLAGITMR